VFFDYDENTHRYAATGQLTKKALMAGKHVWSENHWPIHGRRKALLDLAESKEGCVFYGRPAVV
jgi:hypothetical protein